MAAKYIIGKNGVKRLIVGRKQIIKSELPKPNNQR